MKLAEATENEENAAIRVFMFGPPGVGKTTWAATAPDPIILSFEKGARTVRGVKRTPLIANLEDARSLFRELATGPHAFKSAIIDTADALHELIAAQVCARAGVSSLAEIEYGKGTAAAFTTWRSILGDLDRIHEKGINVILTGHSQIATMTPPDAQPFDRYEPSVFPKAANLIRGWVDFLLFARHEYATKTKDSHTTGVDLESRVIHTRWAPAWDAKQRGNLPSKLPLGDWPAFAALDSDSNAERIAALRAELDAVLEHCPEAYRAAVKTHTQNAGAHVLAKALDHARTKQ